MGDSSLGCTIQVVTLFVSESGDTGIINDTALFIIFHYGSDMFYTKNHTAQKKPHAVIKIIGGYCFKVAAAEASSIVK